MSRKNSSFYWAMRILPREQRQAMHALYDFCRFVDDIADEPGVPAEKAARLAIIRGALAAWAETGVALHPSVAALAPSIEKHRLPVDELILLVDGMEQDVVAPIIAPSDEQLRDYCRKAAGTVGRLSIHIFNRTDADEYALLLAESLQCTNILRDLQEDGERGRLYLPRSCLDAAGIPAIGPRSVLNHPQLPAACMAFADHTLSLFGQAGAALARIGRRNLSPAIIMAATYQAQLRLLIKQNRWPSRSSGLGRPRKLWIAVRAGLTGA